MIRTNPMVSGTASLFYSQEDGEYYMKSTSAVVTPTAPPKTDQYRVRYTPAVTPSKPSVAPFRSKPSPVARSSAQVRSPSLEMIYSRQEGEYYMKGAPANMAGSAAVPMMKRGTAGVPQLNPAIPQLSSLTPAVRGDSIDSMELMYSSQDGQYYMKSTQVQQQQADASSEYFMQEGKLYRRYKEDIPSSSLHSSAVSTRTTTTASETTSTDTSSELVYSMQDGSYYLRYNKADCPTSAPSSPKNSKMSCRVPVAASDTTATNASSELLYSIEDGKLYRRYKEESPTSATFQHVDGPPALGHGTSLMTQQRVAAHPSTTGSVLRIERLQMTSDIFDLSPLLPQVLAFLGSSPQNSVVHTIDYNGSQNEGLWKLNDGRQSLILKLLKSRRSAPDIPTDAEKFVNLASKFPLMVSDLSLSFPVVIFQVCRLNGHHAYDLIVMREAPGIRMADDVAHKKCLGQTQELMTTMKKFGGFLADFHNAYHMQHGDCHASNVFFDETSGLFTIIDVADIAADPYEGKEDDVTYFNKALMTLGKYHGTELLISCCCSVTAGYKERIGIAATTNPLPERRPSSEVINVRQSNAVQVITMDTVSQQIPSTEVVRTLPSSDGVPQQIPSTEVVRALPSSAGVPQQIPSTEVVRALPSSAGVPRQIPSIEVVRALPSSASHASGSSSSPRLQKSSSSEVIRVHQSCAVQMMTTGTSPGLQRSPSKEVLRVHQSSAGHVTASTLTPRYEELPSSEVVAPQSVGDVNIGTPPETCGKEDISSVPRRVHPLYDRPTSPGGPRRVHPLYDRPTSPAMAKPKGDRDRSPSPGVSKSRGVADRSPSPGIAESRGETLKTTCDDVDLSSLQPRVLSSRANDAAPPVGALKLETSQTVCDIDAPLSSLQSRVHHSPVDRAAAAAGVLRVDTVQMPRNEFDLGSLLPQLCHHLGCGLTPSVYAMDNPGGRNEGLWELHAGFQPLILKLLTSKRLAPNVLTDAEKFIELARKCPRITNDISLSFPTMIFQCCGPHGDHLYDLIVMKQAPGLRLADVIELRRTRGQADQLVAAMSSFGRHLANFHINYQMQHGDCHCSNVFFDEADGRFTIIDVSDLGPDPYTSDDDDVTYFNKTLMTLSEFHGVELLMNCCRAVTSGYKERLSEPIV